MFSSSKSFTEAFQNPTLIIPQFLLQSPNVIHKIIPYFHPLHFHTKRKEKKVRKYKTVQSRIKVAWLEIIQLYVVIRLKTQRKEIIKQWNWNNFFFHFFISTQKAARIIQLEETIKKGQKTLKISFLFYIPDGHGLFRELKPALRFWNPPTMQLLYRIIFRLLSVLCCVFFSGVCTWIN